MRWVWAVCGCVTDWGKGYPTSITDCVCVSYMYPLDTVRGGWLPAGTCSLVPGPVLSEVQRNWLECSSWMEELRSGVWSGQGDISLVLECCWHWISIGQVNGTDWGVWVERMFFSPGLMVSSRSWGLVWTRSVTVGLGLRQYSRNTMKLAGWEGLVRKHFTVKSTPVVFGPFHLYTLIWFRAVSYVLRLVAFLLAVLLSPVVTMYACFVCQMLSAMWLYYILELS